VIPMRVMVDYYATLTFNAANDLGDPDLVEHDGPFFVDVPDDWTGHVGIVERALEAAYGHPIHSVGVSGDSVHRLPEPIPHTDSAEWNHVLDEIEHPDSTEALYEMARKAA
jgi:hypothetical protein